MMLSHGSAIVEFYGDPIPDGAHRVAKIIPHRASCTLVMNRATWADWTAQATRTES
jgi:predicted hotdog family 3-hydroxylacyl-ACP dehydratase